MPIARRLPQSFTLPIRSLIARFRRWRPLARILAILGALGAAGLLALTFIPDHILFRQRLAFSILEMSSEREMVALDQRTHDGLTLRSWYVAPQQGRPVIVYFAGRDGDILRKPAHLAERVESGFGLVLVGYRGYGGNPGLPREIDMHRDIQGLVAHLQSDNLAGSGLIFYGYSMGSAFAVNAAAQVDPLAVILEAPLSNFLAAVRQQAGYVPGFLVRTRLDNLSRIPQIRAPILLLAGGRDAVTPPSFAHALAAANPAFASVETFPEANHFNIVRLGGREAIGAFLQAIENRTMASGMASVRSIF
ncbi:dienelactone hydrolase family protein [Mesorhizobium sp. YIM 152430]|uniref:alpha/beta hydrolase n=1 Tax=Mesorhizobium sp. YIM 152430 TaxID=3031761 RepID=UPI0023DBC7DA|nr:dienelactone hydrolase family protein [Mesorhizobium sp. YIM 152430]MDF1600679.1 dienelactone hydrolase family protein [Mesorhizobium sp. YIM 152430]